MRTWTAIRLGRALQRATRDQPGRRGENTPASPALAGPPATPIRSCSRWGLPCRPRHRGRGALLPHRFTLARRRCRVRAVCFLWHFPWGRPRRPLTGTVFPWSPDFPPPLPRGSGRPAVWLSGDAPPCRTGQPGVIQNAMRKERTQTELAGSTLLRLGPSFRSDAGSG